jgi:hypothetical protein
MIVRRLRIVILLLCLPAVMRAATTYRMTMTINNRFKLPPSIQRVIVDGEKRRLTVENAEAPFAYDVLLSTDGGRTVVALNTPLRTWFDESSGGATHERATGLAPWVKTVIKDVKTSVNEEPTTDTVAGFPVRKFVIRASYTTQEDFDGTKVNRVSTVTTVLWSADKLDRSLAFHMPPLDTGVESLDALLRQKSQSEFGFPLRRVTTVSRAYEGGPPVVEVTTIEIDDLHTVPSPTGDTFVRPSAYVNQEPIIGGFKKQ